MSLEFRGKHLEFLLDTTPELDLEGGRSSGKTWVCCAKVIRSCLDHPGIEWLICRYSGEETKTKLRPEFLRLCYLMGASVEWNGEESCYEFPAQGGLISKVFAYGLKTQDKLAHFAKIRGLGVACVWNDQTEELPEEIGTELRAVMRQPGFPHQLIFSPNPPDEDHYLADQFPEDNPIPLRKYYRLSLYDNAHNLGEDDIARLERAYPITHAKHKSLILGQRGPNTIGDPVYEHMFQRDLHVSVTKYDDGSALLEAIDVGKHHPVWMAAQRSLYGGLMLHGGIMGKHLFLEDFIPIIDRYRQEWFDQPRKVQLCCDPPNTDESTAGMPRFTNIETLRDLGWRPRWRDNANSPDVREAVIQQIASLMRRRAGSQQAFAINSDQSRWLIVSRIITKQTKLFVDGCEGEYVWDKDFVSVGNKKIRQPKTQPWLDGWQRCLENIVLNFCVGMPSEADRRRRKASQSFSDYPSALGPNAWMAN